MRRLAAAVILALVLAASADAATQPRLRLTKTNPVAIHGSGFQPRERIRVVVRAATGVSTRRVTAGADGRFSATFRRAIIARCAGFDITASGSAGSHARLVRRIARCTPS
jgi:hypothetical protein